MTRTHISIDIDDEQEVARVLMLLNRERIIYQLETNEAISEEEGQRIREMILKGCPDMDVKKMLNWIEESRQDRKLPFRDE